MAFFETIHVRLTGVAPLLMRSGRLADPLDPHAREIDRVARKRQKTAADLEALARLEWFGGLWVDAGRPCVPAEAIEACVVEAAKLRRAGKTVKAGFICPSNPLLVYDGPHELDETFADTNFHLRVAVQIAGKRTMRTRPCFRAWSLEFDAHFMPTVLDRRDVCEFLKVAGDRVGLGDWRPRFGRFTTQILS
jgi:hypothetical protein